MKKINITEELRLSNEIIEFYVYVYLNLSVPFYVGKGRGKRSHKHLYGHSSNVYVHNKIKNILKSGYKPIIQIINVRNETEAFELEKFLISEIGRIDLGLGSLCNHTDGGEGKIGFKVKESTKLKISKANTGKKRTKEQCKLMSDLKKGKPSNTKGKKIFNRKSAVFSLTHKNNISKSLTGNQNAKALKGKKWDVVKCPHCDKTGGGNSMKRWHFDSCKSK